ncbi:helix-turn-helix domain-containing protein [Devriesea agamarum]|uniref:helix-turn-helix domain-containing protein n=1 Tax=Devriesea agamarum TaxID=472569 RepID=UPI00155DE936
MTQDQNLSTSSNPAPADDPTPEDVLEQLVSSWLTFPDVAEELGVEVSKVRRLVEDGQLVDIRRGSPQVRSVPADLLMDGDVIPHLPGTLTVLRDAGYSDAELLVWLFTDDETLPGRPVDHLRKGQRGEVRRRAQALAF